MNLFILLRKLILFICNIIYYIIISPWLFIKYRINRYAAKKVQINDEGYFTNLLDTRTYYTVADIRDDQMRITTPNSSQWVPTKQHKIL